MKKVTKILTTLFAVALLASCGINGSGEGGSGNVPVDCSQCEIGGGEAKIDLDAINDHFLNDPQWTDFTGPNGYGNKVTLIPFTHINGPRAEWNFFAIVNFEYDAMTYYKYQVTYLSCTCRSADVNYWQTAYVELSVPGSGQADDIKLLRLSFEKDGTGLYLGGFWGDSGIQALEPEGINNTHIFYEDIRDNFIPYLVGKTRGDIKKLSVFEDITNQDFIDTLNAKEEKATTAHTPYNIFKAIEGVEGRETEKVVSTDDFAGVSVSTNNIIRVVNALMDYHAANNI